MKSETSSMNLSKSEAELVRLAQEGDLNAFSALFEVHKARIYSLCLRVADNPAEAEELTQSAFLQVFRRLSDFCQGTDFAVWIYRAAVKTALEQRRKTCVRTVANLSIDHLVQVAGDSVFPRRKAVRFPHMRASVRSVRLNFSANHSWMSYVTTLGRARRAAKLIS